jgi:hypothetical protein
MRVTPSDKTIFVQASGSVQDPPIETFYDLCSLHFGKLTVISLSREVIGRFDQHHRFTLMVV